MLCERECKLSQPGAGRALLSLSGRSLADAFPEILRALAAMRDNLVLDGELVVPDAYGAQRLRRGPAAHLLQRPRMIAVGERFTLMSSRSPAFKSSST